MEIKQTKRGYFARFASHSFIWSTMPGKKVALFTGYNCCRILVDFRSNLGSFTYFMTSIMSMRTSRAHVNKGLILSGDMFV